MQNKNTLIIILVVAALAVGFVAFKHNMKVLTETTQSSNTVSYTDPTYNFSLKYDGSKPFIGDKPFSVDVLGVKAEYVCVKKGVNYAGDPDQLKTQGFLTMSGCQYHQYGISDQKPTADTVANDRINHVLHPFGTNPTVKHLMVSGQQAVIVTANIEDPELPNDALIAITLPTPIPGTNGLMWYVLTIDTTKPFVQDIISSLTFN